MVLACSACAALPSSLPWVTIDRSLSVAVCSREAAESFMRRRVADRAEFLNHLNECKRRADLEKARADAASWWQANAPWIVVGVGLAASAVGFVIGSQVK